MKIERKVAVPGTVEAVVRRFHHGRFYRCPNCGKRGWQEWRAATGKWRGVWGFDCRYCKHTSNNGFTGKSAR
jgi:hypothetical protein